ncbi:uncharacterized protein BDZ99DRAFT_528078 [Mytilinidion resinicola]|uniref:Uncharacterized protein n=1 Tax=Mytilinidion resinicola TaxID=574789 RepID=A0A6A6XZ64_9PEZI|nr:uncharacterized protein BDZ99DRAFT_528078 [Mytilinidion resinicola]KAF2801866.1 hypothetical protein BDZ99DRAFT_528078 [Mytilinidion resinicola]
MKAASSQVQDSFKFFVDSSGTLDTEEVRWLSEDQDLIMKIYQRKSLNLVEPPVIMLKAMTMEKFSSRPQSDHGLSSKMLKTPRRTARWGENAKKINATKMIEPNADSDFLLRANPLYAGTLLVDVGAMVEEAGVALANHHLSIFTQVEIDVNSVGAPLVVPLAARKAPRKGTPFPCCLDSKEAPQLRKEELLQPELFCVAHLYNALHRFDLLDVHWTDIDRIIEQHKGAIFANGISSSPKDAVARFSYRTGLSTRNFRHFNTKMPWRFRTTSVTQALRGFFSSKESLSRLTDNLRTQAESHQPKVYGQGPERSASLKTGKSNKTSILTPRHSLLEMGRYIEAILPDVELDYATLTKIFNKLLKQLRARILSKFGIDYPTIQQYPGDSNDHSLLLVVLGIVTEAKEVSTKRYRGKKTENEDGNDVWKNAPQVVLARDMLETCIGRL